MNNPPGYPLPSGELGDDDIVCQLVYLPDKPEYWQALLGALSYMATWRAWERDEDKRGKDAAADWRDALELTMECWRMTCLDDLKDDVAAILAIMQLPPSCCEDGDVTDGDRYTDRVEDGEGLVPQNIVDAGYASSTSDWAGFDDYKCMISHVIVDQLEARLNEIAPLVDTAGGILGGVAALAGVLAVIFGTGGLAIVFGIVAGIGATSLLYQAITDFGLVESLATKVATNHDDLACAVYNADGDAAALTALNAEIDDIFTAPEALILKNMNLGPTLKALYSGRYDQQDIADILDTAGYEVGDFTCDCDQVGDHLWYVDFETGTAEDWELHDAWVTSGAFCIGTYCIAQRYPQEDYIFTSTGEMGTQASYTMQAGDKILLHRLVYSVIDNESSSGYSRVQITHDGGMEVHNDPVTDAHVIQTHVYDPPLEITHPEGACIIIQAKNDASAFAQWVDNITLDYSIEQA